MEFLVMNQKKKMLSLLLMKMPTETNSRVEQSQETKKMNNSMMRREQLIQTQKRNAT